MIDDPICLISIKLITNNGIGKINWNELKMIDVIQLVSIMIDHIFVEVVENWVLKKVIENWEWRWSNENNNFEESSKSELWNCIEKFEYFIRMFHERKPYSESSVQKNKNIIENDSNIVIIDSEQHDLILRKCSTIWSILRSSIAFNQNNGEK